MRFLPYLYVYFVLIALVFSSCSSDEASADNEDMTNVPFTRDVSIDTCLVIINELTDFCDWKKVFETMDGLRSTYGIEVVELFQGSQDTNLTVSLNNISSLEGADEFINSDKLNSSMNNVSFEDATKLHFLDQQLEYTLETNDTLTMYMTFKTLSYKRWEKAFLDDYRDDPNRDFEVVRVFRGVDEPNHVHMIFKVNDPEYIEKSEQNNAFKMKMLAAGVVSYPVTYKLRDVKI